MPMSKAAIEAAITAANANNTFRQIRQQTPPVNTSSSHSSKFISPHSSHHTQRSYR